MTTSAVLSVVRGPVYHPPPHGSGGPFDLTSALVAVGLVVAAGLYYYFFVMRPKKHRGRNRRSKR